MPSIVALVLLLLGAAAFWNGVEARAAAEPADLVAGPGLLVGTESAADTELRGRPLLRPTDRYRTVGRGRRALGVGLISLALALVALRPVRAEGRPSARWVRAAWLVPGIFGIAQLVSRAGASAPTAAAASVASIEGFAFAGLSFLLLATWRS